MLPLDCSHAFDTRKQTYSPTGVEAKLRRTDVECTAETAGGGGRGGGVLRTPMLLKSHSPDVVFKHMLVALCY